MRLDGKFFRLDDRKFWVKGVTYGPFEPRDDGAHLPGAHQLEVDLRQIAGLGANTVRVYHVPPRSFLDAAHAFQLKVLVDVPWSKHRCFLDSREDREGGRRAVREAARAAKGHPALLALSVVNEIPPDVVRWLGREAVEGFIDELVDVARQEDPEALVTFSSFPSTEYLHARSVDFHMMNVYLHKREKFRAYLQRLQNLADEKPLVLGEYGIDSLRNGEDEQAALLGMHLEEVFGTGLAGTCCFSYTDEWFTGGHPITDWAFGLVRRDRSLKPAFHSVAKVFRPESPLPALPRAPKVSVVVCTYNGSRTLDGCLASLETLRYPDYEVIVVNDGSTDSVPEIAARYPYIRYHAQPNRGLSVARNVGMELARGEIIAYTDDDCFADPDWLYFLVAKLLETGATGVGGPNLLPTTDGPVASCVSASPGHARAHPDRRQRGRARARLQHGLLGRPAARDRRLRPGVHEGRRRRRPLLAPAGGRRLHRVRARGGRLAPPPGDRAGVPETAARLRRGGRPAEAQAPREVPRVPRGPVLDGPHLHARRPRPGDGRARSSITASSAPACSRRSTRHPRCGGRCSGSRSSGGSWRCRRC